MHGHVRVLTDKNGSVTDALRHLKYDDQFFLSIFRPF